jgi:hypothetical protein
MLATSRIWISPVRIRPPAPGSAEVGRFSAAGGTPSAVDNANSRAFGINSAVAFVSVDERGASLGGGSVKR